jgi:membrane-associated phospholipid phosphatase
MRSPMRPWNWPMRPRDWWTVGLCGVLVTLLSLAIDPRDAPRFDERLLDWLGDHLGGPVGDALLGVYQLSGKHFTVFLVLAAIIYLVIRRWWKDLRLLVMATGGILIIIDLWLKPLFDRSRPPEKLLVVAGRSFPSGHAAGAVAFYGAMVVILAAHHPRLRRPLAIAASGWVLLVWLSTLYARAHWPSDLLAGAAVGLAWLTICLAFWRGSAPPLPESVQSGPSDSSQP